MSASWWMSTALIMAAVLVVVGLTYWIGFDRGRRSADRRHRDAQRRADAAHREPGLTHDWVESVRIIKGDK